MKRESITIGPNLKIPREKIEEFCRRWKIKELALFGSVLRKDFGPESDVDVLVTFEPEGGITFDNRVDLLDELEGILGREVDLVEKDLIRNPFRRHEILKTKEVVYAA
jgi:uncharacterized protein